MKKLLILLYGVVSYAIFFAAFLYAIGFVGNFFVPYSIDAGGPETDITMAVVINVLLLSVFALQHSIMARPGFKRWWTNVIPAAAERSTYVLLSSLALVLMYWQWRPITGIVWEVHNETATMVLWGVFGFGWLMVLLSTFMINHFHLFGLLQIYENFVGKQASRLQFSTNFFYKLVRHPIMLGFIIAFWATPVMTVGHLLFAGVTTAYIFVAVKFLEEKDLEAEIGEAYREYQKTVPMIVPFTKFGK